MANEQNLIPFTERSEKETRELGRKGGIASGKARREKARLKEGLQMLMDMQVKGEKNRYILKELGFAEEDMTNDKLAILGLWKAANKGNVEAFREIKKTLGEEDEPNNDTLTKLDEVLEQIGGNILKGNDK